MCEELRDPETSFQESWEFRNLGNTHFLPNLFFRPGFPSSGFSMSESAISGGQELKNQTNQSPGTCFLLIVAARRRTAMSELGWSPGKVPKIRKGQSRMSSYSLLPSAHLSSGCLRPGVARRAKAPEEHRPGVVGKEPKLLQSTGCRHLVSSCHGSSQGDHPVPPIPHTCSQESW